LITVDLMLKLLPVFVLVVTAVEYLRRINNKLDDLVEMNWRTIDLLSRAMGQPAVNNAFEARSGRVIGRKQL